MSAAPPGPADALSGAPSAASGGVSGTVQPGTLIAGRYRLESRDASDVPQASLWRGMDEILYRRLAVWTLAGPNAARAVDEAMRATLARAPLAPRVLDAGRDSHTHYVVTTEVPAQTLADYVPIAPDAARSVIAQVASSLEVAREKAVHHLALRPSAVRIGEGRHVVLTGLGADAAMWGVRGRDPLTDSRDDTVGLVRLLYFALTGYLPDPPVAGVPSAPYDVDGVASLERFAQAFPRDLTLLCADTLTGVKLGPRTPGELARVLGRPGPFRLAVTGGHTLPYTLPDGAARRYEEAAAGAEVPPRIPAQPVAERPVENTDPPAIQPPGQAPVPLDAEPSIVPPAPVPATAPVPVVAELPAEVSAQPTVEFAVESPQRSPFEPPVESFAPVEAAQPAVERPVEPSPGPAVPPPIAAGRPEPQQLVAHSPFAPLPEVERATVPELPLRLPGEDVVSPAAAAYGGSPRPRPHLLAAPLAGVTLATLGAADDNWADEPFTDVWIPQPFATSHTEPAASPGDPRPASLPGIDIAPDTVGDGTPAQTGPRPRLSIWSRLGFEGSGQDGESDGIAIAPPVPEPDELVPSLVPTPGEEFEIEAEWEQAAKEITREIPAVTGGSESTSAMETVPEPAATPNPEPGNDATVGVESGPGLADLAAHAPLDFDVDAAEAAVWERALMVVGNDDSGAAAPASAAPQAPVPGTPEIEGIWPRVEANDSGAGISAGTDGGAIPWFRVDFGDVSPLQGDDPQRG